MALYKTKHINNYTYKDNIQYVHKHLLFKMVKDAINDYDFSTLYTTLTHNLIKDKLTSIEKALLTLHVTTETHFYFRKT